MENGRNASEDFYFPFFLIPPLWIALSILIRRIHDRNKSAFWIFLYFIAGPVIGTVSELYLSGIPQTVSVVFGWSFALVGIIELGFHSGTSGQNQYGPPAKWND